MDDGALNFAFENIIENGAFAPKNTMYLKILWKMEYLLQRANAPFSIIFSNT